MKGINYIGMLLFALMAGCTPAADNECRIHGEMEDHSRDGKKIYLVPLIRPDSVGVDSTVIVDGKFEFATQKNLMAVVRVELRSRYGVEDLLVVTESGDVNVRIGSVSSAGGTPQNDSLQQWKEQTQKYREAVDLNRRKAKAARRENDTLALKQIEEQTDSLTHLYRHHSRSLAAGLKEGPLKTFLQERFPKSYKRKMPDGSVKEIQLD